MGIFDQLLSALGGGDKPTQIPDLSRQDKPQPAAPPVSQPVQHKPPVPLQPAAPKPCPADVIDLSEIFLPLNRPLLSADVPRVELTEAEAIEQGWRFRKKSRERARLLQYCGTAQDIVIPSKIGRYTVNELSGRLFFKMNIRSVQIPETVRKIGEHCFSWSTVQRIVIAAQITEIPGNFACRCEKLTEVRLPKTLRTIRHSAFWGCQSLRTIQLPQLRKIEEYAFCASGLQEFSVQPSRFFESDGTAFQDTPLEKNFRLLAYRCLKMTGFYEIMRVCSGHPKTLVLPEKQFHFGKKSFPNQWNAFTKLDCSLCTAVWISDEALEHGPAYSRRTTPEIILPNGRAQNVFLPRSVDVHFADGKKPEPMYKEVRRSEYQTEYWMQAYRMPPFSFDLPDKNVKLLSRDGRWISYQEKAVCSPTLETLSSDELRGTGKLFTNCPRLRCVRWERKVYTGNQTKTERYEVRMPDAEQIGHIQHIYLLEAFCGWFDRGKKEYHLFSSKRFDSLFCAHDTRRHRFTHEEWMAHINSRTKDRKPDLPRLRQRHKIMLAADVLRSTPTLFPKREMYAEYLRTHKRYALLLCDTLPEDYAAFLQGYYQ